MARSINDHEQDVWKELSTWRNGGAVLDMQTIATVGDIAQQRSDAERAEQKALLAPFGGSLIALHELELVIPEEGVK